MPFLSLKLSLNSDKTTSVTPPAAGPYYYVRHNLNGVFLQPSSTDRYIRP